MQYYINNIPVSKEGYESYEKNRKKRNKTIFLIISIITAGTFVFYFGVFALLENSDAFTKAEEVIRNNKEVLEITSGVKNVMLETGSVKTEGTTGEAEFYIEVDGIKKDTGIYIHLKKNKNKWEADDIKID